MSCQNDQLPPVTFFQSIEDTDNRVSVFGIENGSMGAQDAPLAENEADLGLEQRL